MTVEENLRFCIAKLRIIQDTIKKESPHRQGGGMVQPYQGWSNFIDNEVTRLNVILSTSLFSAAPAKNPAAADKHDDVAKADESHQPTLGAPLETNPSASRLNKPRSNAIRRVQRFLDEHADWLSLGRQN